MPYDPTKPVNGAPIIAAELRAQFAGLNDNISGVSAELATRPSSDDVGDMINANASGPVTGLAPPGFIVSNPPTQAEVQAIADFVTAMYLAQTRT